MSATERRRQLYEWLRERPEHQGLTTRELVDLSGIYDGSGGWMEDRMSRAARDLNALRAEGLIQRVSRPARWQVPG